MVLTIPLSVIGIEARGDDIITSLYMAFSFAISFMSVTVLSVLSSLS
jgi:hypothetical protein